ncbi:F-box protein SKIP8-like isoform X2 [Salvia divinorum]|uniref:F-box protein SKIP8-like isoform X2 n=1 Tax=Salvia divinorum TaxID=28513 RepID=A0ABD1H1P3_SALDI
MIFQRVKLGLGRSNCASPSEERGISGREITSRIIGGVSENGEEKAEERQSGASMMEQLMVMSYGDCMMCSYGDALTMSGGELVKRFTCCRLGDDGLHRGLMGRVDTGERPSSGQKNFLGQ